MRTEDGYFIYKSLNGDKSAFGFLVDKYRESVYALAYDRLNNFHDAEDIAQEVFIQAFKKLHTLKRWDSFASWLYRITTRMCLNWLRSHSRRPDYEYIEDKSSKDLQENSIEFHNQQMVDYEIRDMVEILPEIYRQAITLHYLGGMTSEEIANFVGVSPSAIRKRLIKAREILREEILSNIKTEFESQRLQAGFTFRVLDTVKNIKVKPSLDKPKIALGLSSVTAIILAVIGLYSNPHLVELEFKPFGQPLDSSIKIPEVGEIPVDVLDVPKNTMLGTAQGRDKTGSIKTEVLLYDSYYNTLSQTEVKGEPINPVMPAGVLGGWDSHDHSSPNVIFDGREFKMWYRAANYALGSESRYRVGYAVSSDGVHWHKYYNNPVLENGPEGSWDEKGVFYFHVLRDRNQYHLWYVGLPSCNLGYAFSHDGINWTKYSGNPVMKSGEDGGWNNKHIIGCSVLRDSGEYKMWYYEIVENKGKRASQISLAFSRDGISWTPYSDNPVLRQTGKYGNGTPHVIFNGVEYIMWYPISDPTIYPASKLVFATSPDGMTWTQQPIIALQAGDEESWDYLGVQEKPAVIFDGKKYRMWYSGYDYFTTNRIGYAESDKPYGFKAFNPTLTRKAGPDTRIPYSLSEGAEVTIEIYEWLKFDGPLVRTLHLGYQPAGDYSSKEKAAYWDGKDEYGQPVANGLYDAVIRAGGKMGGTRLKISNNSGRFVERK
ncbi:sigma-70 family RNA polymerase sigma factor [Candidatus Poribacteria bacterium]|nr:sigma-70 family RNA polymerase sigma factor [Candidatus Poribacteria bacterium]